MTIKEAMTRAEALDSKLTPDYIKKLTGLASPKVWHLLNNLCAASDSYLEVGSYMGSSLMAALYNNDVYAVAIDNFCMKPKTRGHFFQNVKHLKFDFFEEDAFALDISKIKQKIGVFFYDGSHSYEDQLKALKYFYPILKDEFIFVCDDWNLEAAQNGTMQAIEDMKLEILESEDRHCPNKSVEDWWCGIACLKLKKPLHVVMPVMPEEDKKYLLYGE